MRAPTRPWTTLGVALICLALVPGCSEDGTGSTDGGTDLQIVTPDGPGTPDQGADAQAADGGNFVLTSTAFADNGTIPAKHTCDDQDISPALSWSGVPAGTASLALIVDDPDAPSGTFTHWIIYGIAATASGLQEAVPPQATVQGVGMQGVNDFSKTQYNGPCPPSGLLHHYVFTLHALDLSPSLQPGSTLAQVNAAIQGHVLAKAVLTGTYQR